MTALDLWEIETHVKIMHIDQYQYTSAALVFKQLRAPDRVRFSGKPTLLIQKIRHRGQSRS